MLDTGYEILVKYFLASSCLEKDAKSFHQFLTSTKNPNIKLLQIVVLEYVTGYFMIKAGIRACNFGYFMEGKELVAPLFFARNHPLCRKVNLFLDFDLATMPRYMFEQFKATIGLKVANKGSSDVQSCEHFDFVVESVNKKIKSNLSWAPTNKQWLTACRTYSCSELLTANFNKHFNFSRLTLIIS